VSPASENEVLESVELSRRGFVKKVVLGSAFAVPLVASFDMRSLTAAAADCYTPNQSQTLNDDVYQLQILNPNMFGKGISIKVKVRKQSTLKNVSSKHLKLRLRAFDPSPGPAAPDLPIAFEFKRTKRQGRHYRLDLDTKHWEHGYYSLFVTAGSDPTNFNFSVQVGGC
jgi:hypothetical protein